MAALPEGPQLWGSLPFGPRLMFRSFFVVAAIVLPKPTSDLTKALGLVLRGHNRFVLFSFDLRGLASNHISRFVSDPTFHPSPTLCIPGAP